jgi:hypothetical protein
MATHVLDLQIGSTNIPLADTDAMLLDYVPQTAQLRATGQGQELYDIERQTVTETIRLWLYAGSGAAVQTKIADIDNFISRVHRRQRTRTGDRGYLYLQMSSDTANWRSEVLSARLEVQQDGLRHWAANGTEALLIVTRRPYWEAVSETEIELDNGSTGSPTTGGVTIYNHDDGDANHDNWVDIASTEIEGNLPAPLRLAFKSTTGGTVASRDFWIAANTHNDPANFDHILEGEDADSITVLGTAGQSGAQYGRGSWTTSIAHTTNLFNWILPTAMMADCAGDFFRVVARFTSAPSSDYEFQLHVKFPGDAAPTTTLWDGPKFTSTGRKFQDLGIVQLPPGIPSDAHDSVSLVLTMAYDGGSGNLDIDFVQLTPAHSTRYMRQIGYGLVQNDQIVSDGPAGRAYAIDAATGVQWNILDAYDPTLYAWPGRAQRLYFLHDENTDMDISRTWSVRAYYRARRSTL